MQHKDHSMAEMIALGVGVGMESSNFNVITEALDWAKQDSDLMFVFVLDENNEMFASYNPTNLKLSVPDLMKYSDVFELYGKPHHIVHVPITYQESEYGKLLLCTSLDALYSKISRNTFVTLIISLAIFLVGTLV